MNINFKHMLLLFLILGSIIPTSSASSDLNHTVMAFYNRGYDWPAGVNYSAITTIAYSFLFVRADGTVYGDQYYNPNEMISYAHARDTKVVVVVRDDPLTPGTDALLLNASARTIAVNGILSEIQNRGFDGVNIDLEDWTYSAGKSANMTDFMHNLSSMLWNNNPSYQIIMTVGAYYPGGANTYPDSRFNLSTIQNYVNFIMVMGYDWYGAWVSPTTAGPNAPNMLDNGKGNNDTFVHLAGIMNKSKILYGVPYYGYEYQVTSKSRLATRSTGGTITELYYYNIDTIKSYTTYYDSTWQTPWYTRKERSQWYQGHYENTISLGQKYDYVNQNSLGGVGIWEISMGSYHSGPNQGLPIPELNSLLVSKFTTK